MDKKGNIYVLKSNVPEEDLIYLDAWFRDCSKTFGNNRWKKMLSDHTKVMELSVRLDELIKQVEELKNGK